MIKNFDKNQKIKRPLNSFMIYLKEKRNELIINNPDLNQNDICVMFSKMWKKENENIKQKYKIYSDIVKKTL